MNQVVNDIYQAPMTKGLKDHLVKDLGFSEEDRVIINSLMEHNADSSFHYDNTGIGRGKFERRLNNINRVIFPELVRLANQSYK